MPLADAEVQAIFDRMVSSMAVRLGFRDAETFVAEKMQGVIFHFTLNFMSGHTIKHNDEYIADGSGRDIYNWSLQGGGLLYFVEDKKRPDGTKLGMHAVWQVLHTHVNTKKKKHTPTRTHTQNTGDCIGFTGDARIYMKHGVLKEDKVCRLPVKVTEGVPNMDNIRVVCARSRTHTH